MIIKKLAYPTLSILLLSGFVSGTQANPIESYAESRNSSQEELILSGRAQPYQEVIVSTAMEGTFKGIYKEIGAYVVAGEKLAELDEGNLAELVQRAKDQVKMVEAQGNLTAMEQQIALNQTLAGINYSAVSMKIAPPIAPTRPEMPGYSELEATQKALKDAELILDNKNKELDEAMELFEEGILSQKEFDTMTVAKARAEQNVASSQEKVAREMEKIELLKEYEKEKAEYEKEKANYDQQMKGSLQETQVSAEDTLRLQKQSAAVTDKMKQIAIINAKSELEAVKNQYDKLPIVAPVNGFITELNGRIGEMVSPGETLFLITNLDQLYITINVPEAIVNKWKKGQTVSVNFPTQGIEKNGKVVYVGLMPNRGENTYPVKIIVENKDHNIRGGMRAVATLKMDNETNETSESANLLENKE
ncbi:MAG TPA: HlyD family efflux transporter periplasmic adaptor subunit [Bacillales bacterium]|nr:HlyD family efflux transporter periplasmic adaptor subunit [Bacillales bacterium]